MIPFTTAGNTLAASAIGGHLGAAQPWNSTARLPTALLLFSKGQHTFQAVQLGARLHKAQLSSVAAAIEPCSWVP